MSALDRELLAERTMVVRRHLARVSERLPARASDLLPATDASDAAPLADRLARAAGFRHAIAHAYDRLDMARVHRTAMEGPRDLEAFLGALRDRL